MCFNLVTMSKERRVDIGLPFGRDVRSATDDWLSRLIFQEDVRSLYEYLVRENILSTDLYFEDVKFGIGNTRKIGGEARELFQDGAFSDKDSLIVSVGEHYLVLRTPAIWPN